MLGIFYVHLQEAGIEEVAYDLMAFVIKKADAEDFFK